MPAANEHETDSLTSRDDRQILLLSSMYQTKGPITGEAQKMQV